MYHHFNELQDVHGGAWILFCGTSRWLSIRLDTIISFYIAVVALIMVPLRVRVKIYFQGHLIFAKGEKWTVMTHAYSDRPIPVDLPF